MTAGTDESPALGRPGSRGGRARVSGELLLTALLGGLGVYVLIETPTIMVPPAAAVAGPRLFPYLIGGLLLGVAVLLTVQVLRGRHAPPEEGEDIDLSQRSDKRAVLLLVGLFAGHAVLIEPIGWPLAAALLFAGTAVILGARRWWVIVVSALGLALALWAIFVFGLGAYLPGGPLQGLIG
ncbi:MULTISPECIES: tripartite tricarboxylate transporter TctB family protein [unclassified Crossiella]|uniref:tripartite tricarboxylate transporter TctB family protein n=1 Tax=unclassified Crossiella TaxID=2620835 RepID=UPI0020002540|nr:MULTISPECIES: tripartite tricarboxylate transporter TctB family protein [unclassified Crossiella]MCK2237927.1 tripartite tricarboxylate transporter TctB family protein [Crossiella sp. S99.2]MCK2255213.1 tripartite tricarboxylate transporter TctB family protein [Crossiella sp. S99.1]